MFFFLFLIYFITGAGHIESSDGVQGFLLTENLALYHSINLNPNSPGVEKFHIDVSQTSDTGKGGFVSRYGPLHSILAVPIYSIAHIMGIDPSTAIDLLFNSTVVALIGVVLFSFSTKLYHSLIISFIIVLFFGITSFIWIHSRYFLDQPLGALTLISSVYFLYLAENEKRKKFLIIASILVVLSIFARIADILTIIGIFTYGLYTIRRDLKAIVSFVIPIIMGVLSYGFYNMMKTGSFMSINYGGVSPLSIQSHMGIAGLYGLFISPGVGLIWYFPLTIFLPLGFYWFYKIDKKLSILSIYIFLSLIIFIGTITWDYPKGWSGGTWGPRYLIPSIPFVSLVLGTVVKKFSVEIYKKVLLIITGALGFAINFIGVLVYFMYAYAHAWGVEELWKDQNSMNIITWNINYILPVENIKILSSNFLATAYQINDIYATWGLSPCNLDIYFYCRYGLLPIIIALLVIAILLALIIYNLRGSRNQNENTSF